MCHAQALTRCERCSSTPSLGVLPPADPGVRAGARLVALVARRDGMRHVHSPRARGQRTRDETSAVQERPRGVRQGDSTLTQLWRSSRPLVQLAQEHAPGRTRASRPSGRQLCPRLAACAACLAALEQVQRLGRCHTRRCAPNWWTTARPGTGLESPGCAGPGGRSPRLRRGPGPRRRCAARCQHLGSDCRVSHSAEASR